MTGNYLQFVARNSEKMRMLSKYVGSTSTPTVFVNFETNNRVTKS